PREHLLAERHHACHPGEQHESEADDGGEADVVQQRDLELGQDERRRGDERDERAQHGACGNHSPSSSSSSTWRERSESQMSGGMMMAKTIVSLNALDQNETYDSSRPSTTEPSTTSG